MLLALGVCAGTLAYLAWYWIPHQRRVLKEISELMDDSVRTMRLLDARLQRQRARLEEARSLLQEAHDRLDVGCGLRTRIIRFVEKEE